MKAMQLSPAYNDIMYMAFSDASEGEYATTNAIL